MVILAKLANLAKIRQRCGETCNELLKGSPSLVTNVAKHLPLVSQ